MIFSLIVPTIHRTAELDQLLASIAGQKARGIDLRNDVETIVVDQNPDDRLEAVLKPYLERLTLVRIKAPPFGQSNAKNIGMKNIRGQYVAFPDDDCFFAEDTLEKVLGAFHETKGEQVLFGRGMDLKSGHYLLRYPSAPQLIKGPKNPAAFLGLQIAQFYTAPMVRAVGDFDVDLCSGGKWGSGEETDFALRALKKGYSISFRPEILVYHPLVTPGNVEIEKLKRYSVGFGALCRKQGLYGLLFQKTVKQFFGFVVFFVLLNFKKSKVNWTTVVARLQGFRRYREEGNRTEA